MKKIVKIVLLGLLTFTLFACGNGGGSDAKSGGSGTAAKKDVKKPKLEMSIKEYGIMTLELEPEYAPITVENFLKLVNDGFYDKLSFTRAIPDYMIIGGDPVGDGTGGTGTSIKGEFSSNGVDNPLKHTRGAISMARLEGQPDSASSQFMIIQKDNAELDGACAVFGYVTSGIEIVDKICEEVPIDEYGFIDFTSQPVIEYIKVIG